MKKVFLWIIALVMLLPTGLVFSAAEESLYCSVSATFAYADRKGEQKTEKFQTLDEYLAFAGNRVTEGETCSDFSIDVYRDNAQVVYRPTSTYRVNAHGHSFQFVGTDGGPLRTIQVDGDHAQHLILEDAVIGGSYEFNVAKDCELRFIGVTMDGGGGEYRQDIFNLYQGARMYLEHSVIRNFNLAGNTEIIDFVDNNDDPFARTQLKGDGGSGFENISSEDEGVIRLNGTCDQIDGVNFTNCSSDDNGGALYIRYGFVYSCRFQNCYADDDGGAIYMAANGSNASIRDCYFDNNYAEGDGGAIYIYSSADCYVDIEKCTFYENSTDGDGGAVYSDAENVNITNCEFGYNHADEDGGGLYINDEDNTIENCVFDWNSSDVDGGGACINDDRAQFYGCNFMRNHAYDDGGAAYVTVGTDDVLFSGCSFWNNRADDDCDDVDGRSDTVINGSGAVASGGNVILIVCVAGALLVILAVLIILQKKRSGGKAPGEEQ